MAGSMSYFLKNDKQHLVILVATSGDTGGAVASGFYKTPGVDVVILYPSGKVSALQEKQLTALGHNITAIEVDGTFDDCQNMVKQAFIDKELNQKMNLSSANSINIARLIPQSFYYFEAYKQLPKPNGKVVFSVPSGNFGNLCAGLFAQKMGLPIHRFIAATNANDVVPQYLATGNFSPHASIATISNAMDVGNPSNFHRILALYNGDWSKVCDHIKGFTCTDNRTRKAVLDVYNRYKYVIDPHAAVGFAALEHYLTEHKNDIGIVLETAHPSKFLEVVDKVLGFENVIPERLKVLEKETKVATYMSTSFSELKSFLNKRF
jgi:threonine synthase